MAAGSTPERDASTAAGAGIAADRLVRKTALYYVSPVMAFVGQFDAGYLGQPSSRAACRDLWRERKREYQRNLNPGRSFLAARDLNSLGFAGSEMLGELLSTLARYPNFDIFNTQFYNVPLSKLVTPQLTVTDVRVAAHAGRVRADSTLEEKLDYVSARGIRDPLIDHQLLPAPKGGGAHLFTTRHDDVRVHLPPRMVKVPVNEADPAAGLMDALAFPVGEGLPVIHAFKFKLQSGAERLILGNGVHRVVAAISAGLGSLPIAVSDVQLGDLSDPFVELSLGFALNHNADPPLVADFLNERLAMHLGYFGGQRAIRFTWNLDQNVVLEKRTLDGSPDPTQ